MIEAKQEVPSWLEALASESKNSGGSSRRGRNRYANQSTIIILSVCRRELLGFDVFKCDLLTMVFKYFLIFFYPRAKLLTITCIFCGVLSI